jgi:hypothetical protein
MELILSNFIREKKLIPSGLLKDKTLECEYAEYNNGGPKPLKGL